MVVDFSSREIRYLHERKILAVWDWIAALDAFDFADPEPLDRLLAECEEIPEFMHKHLSDIVAGRRKPNKKAAAKLKIPARERMKIGATLSGVLGVMDKFRGEMFDPDTLTVRPAMEVSADRRGVEVIDAVRSLEGKRRRAIDAAMREFNVSEETVENLLRDVREKIRNFPEV